ncbi:1-acyl-sn-glycerol-3-phosphate acyltransferase [Sphingobacterium sp.]|uniref:1-acyl-sn-glycerol-3-phosphate acyltransferase n=1 Tax=Sphingobacterium sp. TaxID=341027 RepID=UPI0025910CBB|nr:1-acyl-sn-glycerol-3-phosphate acyltransferase [Sphingobacterium sp.]WET69205.1 MAG: 1-acyl-sn-glycerol-3-phosphate acyltransferase [Sphingobacterium sp.]
MQHYFYQLYLFFKKKPYIAWLVALLFLVATGYFALKLKFEEDITRIIPQNERTNEVAKILTQLKFSDKISVIIEREKDASIDDMVEMANSFSDSIVSLAPYYHSIQGQISDAEMESTMQFVYQHLPTLLDENDYKTIASHLPSDSIAQVVEANYAALISPTSIVAKSFIQRDPLGIGFMALKKFQKLSIAGDFQLYNGYIITKDSSKLLLFINPKYSGSETAHNAIFVDRLDKMKSELNEVYLKKTKLSYFGSSLVAVANAKQIKTDIQTTILISMSLLMLILILFYKKVQIPVIIFIPSLFGALLALAFLYFLRGTISAISISIAAVLIGITIDYALHIMTHFKQTQDIKHLYKEITKPILMSAGTTAVSFLCLLFVNSEALKDLGIFAFIAILFSGIFSLILIPHIYKPNIKTSDDKNHLIDRISAFSFERNKPLQIFSYLLLIVSLFTFWKVGFNKDLSALNFFPKELQEAEYKLENSAQQQNKSLFLINYGNNIDQVLSANSVLYSRLQQDTGMIAINSIGEIVLSKKDQEAKIAQWNSFWTDVRKTEIRDNLIRSSAAFGFKPTAYQAFFSLLDQKFSTVTWDDYQKLNNGILSEYISSKDGFFTANTIVKTAEGNREKLIKQFNNGSTVVIDRKEMNETFLGQLVNDFNTLVNYSFVAIFVILWLSFRRIELTLISMVPIVLTGLVTGGLMGLFHLEFNIFSTIVCTLVFSHGVDFAIFMTAALQKEYSTGKDEMPTYRTSILLAVLTTILAIGALIFAKHPALRSISAVSLLGVTAAVLNTFVLYPLVFRFVFRRRPSQGLSPLSLRLRLISAFSFSYYIIGSMLSGLLFSLISNRAWMTRVMSRFGDSVLKSNPFVKKQQFNAHDEDFKKPAIIIANHNSLLDTLLIGRLLPKCVFVTNEWVYKSPVFGRVVRRAGFLMLDDDLEKSKNILKQRIDAGYSIAIFPEGTRSATNDVQRFHKGAFYIAEQLQLDILPIYIHGAADVCPKGDFVIYDGTLSTVIGERIRPTDQQFGDNYSARCKTISRLFKQQFADIRKQFEGPTYFREKISLNYRYKETEIEKLSLNDFDLHQESYATWNNFIAANAKILHIGNDFGHIDFLLTMQQAQRHIESYIRDPEKRAIAGNTYLKHKRKLTYLNQPTETTLRFDVLIWGSNDEKVEISDSIHTIVCYDFLEKPHYIGFEEVFKDQYSCVLKRRTNG